MADVPKISVATVDLLAAGGDRNAMLRGIVQTVFAGLQSPLAPGRNDFELRRKSLVCQLESDLVVAFAGASMGNGSCAFSVRNFQLVFGDYRTRQRCS